MGVVIALAVIIVVYLLLIMPRILNRPDDTALKGWYYAHRGFHDNQTAAPENSMKAFEKAVKAGYGIELDVQVSKDLQAVVFHDKTLRRVCAVDGKVSDYTYAELQKFRLCESNEKIPLLKDVLELVDGKVPLVIELKCYEKAGVICQTADQLLKDYKGTYCVESFHPLALQWYRQHRPEVIRGQLATNFRLTESGLAPYLEVVHYLLTNVMCRPDFIAYDYRFKNNLSRKLCCGMFGAASVGWTIRSQQTMDACRGDFDLFIFEGFRPTKK